MSKALSENVEGRVLIKPFFRMRLWLWEDLSQNSSVFKKTTGMNVYGWEQFQVSQAQGCILKNVSNFLKLHFVVRVLFGKNFRSFSCDLSYLDKTNKNWN